MGTTPRLAMRLVSPLALLLLGALPFSCYRPAIVDGGLKCNLDAGAKACPDGFRCDTDGRCRRHPDGGMDTGMTDASDAGDATPDTDGPPICIMPVAGCTPATTGTCDPSCQTGCACREKCSVNAIGSLTCNVPRTQGYPRGLMQSCTIESGNSAAQTDNCGAGLVCIEDGCFARCFQFCKSDNDCSNSSCTRDVGSGQKVCDVPWVDCTPLGSGGNAGCPVGGNMACYISSATPTHTICDCPQMGVPGNAPCTKTRDCFPGLACVDRPTFPNPMCLQVCRLSLNGSDCPSMTAGSCHPYTGLPSGQPSNPTFGYCF